MTARLKGLVALAVLAVSFMLIAVFATQTRANNRVKKYEVIHNGQHLCLPAPGRDGHLREHPNDVLVGCCDNCDVPSPDPDPSPLPPPQ